MHSHLDNRLRSKWSVGGMCVILLDMPNRQFRKKWQHIFILIIIHVLRICLVFCCINAALVRFLAAPVTLIERPMHDIRGECLGGTALKGVGKQ